MSRGHARPNRREPATSWLSRHRKRPGMPSHVSIFGSFLKLLNEQQLQAIVKQHNGDAYDKSFKSRDHLVALIFAQLSGIDSLRGLENSFNANSHLHSSLGVGRLARSTL